MIEAIVYIEDPKLFPITTGLHSMLFNKIIVECRNQEEVNLCNRYNLYWVLTKKEEGQEPLLEACKDTLDMTSWLCRISSSLYLPPEFRTLFTKENELRLHGRSVYGIDIMHTKVGDWLKYMARYKSEGDKRLKISEFPILPRLRSKGRYIPREDFMMWKPALHNEIPDKYIYENIALLPEVVGIKIAR